MLILTLNESIFMKIGLKTMCKPEVNESLFDPNIKPNNVIRAPEGAWGRNKRMMPTVANHSNKIFILKSKM